MTTILNRAILGADMRNALGVNEALPRAINALIATGAEDNMRAAVTLLAIHDHMGCDNLDCGTNPENAGRLTAASSVMVFG